MANSLQAAHEDLITHALSLPGAWVDHPWGERVAKVGPKVFVFFGKSTPDEPRLTLAVKLPSSGLRALDLAFTEPTGYGMGKHGWVSATFTPGETPPAELLRAWVVESYRAIAPKKLVKELDARAEGGAKQPAKQAPAPARATPARARAANARATAAKASAKTSAKAGAGKAAKPRAKAGASKGASKPANARAKPAAKPRARR